MVKWTDKSLLEGCFPELRTIGNKCCCPQFSYHHGKMCLLWLGGSRWFIPVWSPDIFRPKTIQFFIDSKISKFWLLINWKNQLRFCCGMINFLNFGQGSVSSNLDKLIPHANINVFLLLLFLFILSKTPLQWTNLLASALKSIKFWPIRLLILVTH